MKGQDFKPSSANEGVWFQHRGESQPTMPHLTSTKEMLEAPFSAPPRPKDPPTPFIKRQETDYKAVNPFTQHDNRHYFQDKGEYLGDGRDTRYLGRRLHPVHKRLHHTDSGYLHHNSRNPTLHDYNPITSTSFRHVDPAEPLKRRRFPRTYRQSDEEVTSMSLTRWHTSPSKTYLQVMASSQEPFLPHNSWKYSYHGDYKVYPPYDRKKLPKVPNILNRYGPDFSSAPPRLAEVTKGH